MWALFRSNPLLGGAKLIICPSSSLGCLERVGRSVPPDGHSGGERPAGCVGRSVRSDGHSLGERPEEWVGRSVHPDTGKAAGRRLGRSVGVHPEAQNSQSSERLSDARAALL
jgi:hypothetical protein